jgi:exopolyphosphatase/guanosine-5'-triphosphate,3'-diphosphate pyrophosphatase
MAAVKIAAIDVGSNSIHMVIVEVSASGGFEVIDREKQMVRLGERTLSSGRLPAAAMRRGLEVLRQYRRIADSHGVEKTIAVATSAIREASNGEDFLEAAGREVGIWPKAVSGEEEARLIYLAALHSIHLEGRRALVVDIGGGSLELALGAGQQIELTASEKLGVLRMSEAYVRTDPITSKDEARLVRHVQAAVEPAAARIREARFDVAVGTSGTILALGAMAHAIERGAVAEDLHHVTVKVETLHALRKRMVTADLRTRLRITGMDEGRADIIVAGAIVLDTVLSQLGVEALMLCQWALREGILLDYIHGHPRSLARAEAYPDVRRRSVVSLGERCLWDEPHARHVASLALVLFDAVGERLGLGAPDRALLEFAALLHDVGHHISYPGHHKHSYYLIKNGGLRGFHPVEIEVLATVARYHRRGLPRKKHPGFAALPRERRRAVRGLAGILRLADALDRSHRQVVRRLHVSARGGSLRVVCETDGDSELELWGAERRADLLAEELGAIVRVEPAPIEAGVTRLRPARS